MIFFNLIESIIKYKPVNLSVDCYTKAAIDKFSLLSIVQERYGLQYELSKSINVINSTGLKQNYFSLNKKASIFGFKPEKTSLDCILAPEVTQLFSS